LSSSAATSQSHSALVIDFCFSALHTSQTPASVSASPVNSEGFQSDFALLPVDNWVVFVQPGKTKDDPLFSEAGHIKTFFELSFAKGKLEVDIGIDRSSFVFRSVHVITYKPLPVCPDS
jgi:hypothetical protein